MDGCLGWIGRHDTHRSVQAIRLERRQEADLRRMVFFWSLDWSFHDGLNFVQIRTAHHFPSPARLAFHMRRRTHSLQIPCLEREATPNRSERPDIGR